MKRITRIRRSSVAKFEVAQARDRPGGIQVKVLMPMHGTKVKSQWMKVHMMYYWKNNRRFRIKKITGDVPRILMGTYVRIPKMEKEHRISIRKQQNTIYKRNN